MLISLDNIGMFFWIIPQIISGSTESYAWEIIFRRPIIFFEEISKITLSIFYAAYKTILDRSISSIRILFFKDLIDIKSTFLPTIVSKFSKRLK